MASRVMVIPLPQTCTTSRGIRLNAPHPVSLLVITNPENTTGLSAPGRAGERAAVPGQQRRGQDPDLLADDPHVHPPLGQVTPVDPDRHPGLADTIEGGEQDVEVVDDLVPVGQERPRHPSARSRRAGSGAGTAGHRRPASR